MPGVRSAIMKFLTADGWTGVLVELLVEGTDGQPLQQPLQPHLKLEALTEAGLRYTHCDYDNRGGGVPDVLVHCAAGCQAAGAASCWLAQSVALPHRPGLGKSAGANTCTTLALLCCCAAAQRLSEELLLEATGMTNYPNWAAAWTSGKLRRRCCRLSSARAPFIAATHQGRELLAVAVATTGVALACLPSWSALALTCLPVANSACCSASQPLLSFPCSACLPPPPPPHPTPPPRRRPALDDHQHQQAPAAPLAG